MHYRSVMRVDMITKEYPPEIYGGAGVHVAELVAALRESIDVRVRAFGADRADAGSLPHALEIGGTCGAVADRDLRARGPEPLRISPTKRSPAFSGSSTSSRRLRRRRAATAFARF